MCVERHIFTIIYLYFVVSPSESYFIESFHSTEGKLFILKRNNTSIRLFFFIIDSFIFKTLITNIFF